MIVKEIKRRLNDWMQEQRSRLRKVNPYIYYI
jgi:hypothetical protein